MAHTMEITDREGEIFIQDHYQGDKSVCFYRELRFEGKEFKIDSSDCRGRKEDIVIDNIELIKKLNIASNEILKSELRLKRNTLNLYKYLGTKAEQYFTEKVDEKDFDLLENRALLRFKVKNLKAEVLDEGLFDWTTKTEWLEFIIICQLNDHTINISCEVEGKYGSGIFRTTEVKGFNNMEPEYETALSDYTKKFTTTRLIIWLTE